MKTIKKVIKEAYQDFGNDQRSTLDQLIDLHEVANLLKMYDAADFLQEKINQVIYTDYKPILRGD